MTAAALFFWVITAVTGTSAVLVVVTQNIVRAAVWLLFTLLGTAILYFQLASDFVGATQLIVYVGGTLVLVVFGVMLTAQGPFVTMRAGAAEWGIAAVAGTLFFGVLAASAVGVVPPLMKPVAVDPATSPTTETLGYAFLGLESATPKEMLVTRDPASGRETFRPLRDDDNYNVRENQRLVPVRLTGYPDKMEAPVRTRMAYLLPFEIVSVHLLVVLIGAAYLARAKRRRIPLN